MEDLTEAAKAEDRAGTYATPVLYEEMVGVYLLLKAKGRQGNIPSEEIKVSITHTGIYEDASEPKLSAVTLRA